MKPLTPSRAGWWSAVAAAALLAAPAAGQYEGVFLTSPFSLGATHETKFIVDGRELSDNVLILAPPTVSLLRMSPRGEFSLSYQPELQAFATHRELTAVNHNAELVFNRAVTPHLTVALGDTLISTSDPSRRMVDSVLLLPRDRITENAFHAELSRRFGHATTFTLKLDNTVTLVADPETSGTGLIDRVASAGSASLSRRVARRHLLIGTYMLLDSRPLSPGEARPRPGGFTLLAPEPEQAHLSSLSYLYDGDTFRLRMAGGLVYGRDLLYTGAAQIDKRFGRSTLTVVAQRNLSFFGGAVPSLEARLGVGVQPFGLYESAVARLRFEVSRSLSVQIQTAAQRTFSELTDLEVRSDFGRVKAEYRLGRAVSFFGIAEAYRQSFNELIGVPMAWQRYGVGLEIYASSKPNPLEERRRTREERERRLRRGEAVDDDSFTPATRGVSAESSR